jgi:hypothetical protein
VPWVTAAVSYVKDHRSHNLQHVSR